MKVQGHSLAPMAEGLSFRPGAPISFATGTEFGDIYRLKLAGDCSTSKLTGRIELIDTSIAGYGPTEKSG